jgi:putative ABC transport system ATP-binding protein
MMPLLEAQHLTRRSRDGTWLLHDVSLALQVGDRLALRGRSGAGKTLLLRALALLDPCDGELLWRGECPRAGEVPRFRSQVVYLQQRTALTEGDVESMLREPFAWATHARRSFQRDVVIALCESLGRSAEFLRKRQRDLSGGESLLVALMRALQLEPSILLLDEPTSALDHETAIRVERSIDRWASAGERAVVWVSHDAEQLDRVTNRCLRMEAGRIATD